MKLTRGLHPKTRPQREGRPGHWAALLRTANQVEYSDAPMRAVAITLGLAILLVLIVVGGVLIFTSAIKPRTPLMAGTAAAHFKTAGPPLLATPEDQRSALEKAHSGPGDAAIERAMDQVVRQGWGETAPPPGRATVAMGRAKAGAPANPGPQPSAAAAAQSSGSAGMPPSAKAAAQPSAGAGQ